MKEFEGTITCTYEAEGIIARASSKEEAVKLIKEREESVCPGKIVDIEVDILEEKDV
jgi:hypothetical protein